MDKRYQVFISSTYADLKEERQRVIQTVMEMDCIPAGMELFPAADEEQFEFIKKVINDCDYYLLIIGGRYGSTTPEGISYTEKEYDYAISIGLKVIAFIHQDPDSIPFGKSEQDAGLRAKLQEFRDRVSTGRLVKHWTTAAELPGLVSQSLAKTIKTFPAVGWVRANKVASEELLTEINNLRKENGQLRTEVAKFGRAPQITLPNLAGLDDSFEFKGRYWTSRSKDYWRATAKWREVFGFISPYLDRHPADDYVKSILTTALFERSVDYARGHDPELNDQQFRTVAVQLKALGLVTIDYLQTVGGGMGLFWSITNTGERLMIEVRTVRKGTPGNQG